MSHTEHEEPILRTSPARLGKMLAILLGIMVVGGAIFFLNYDYWNSYLPTAGKIQEEGAAGSHAATGQGTATGKL
jgi:nitrite reductase (NO-forming)